MIYCFKCPVCGYTTQQAVRDPAPSCVHPDSPPKHKWCMMIRDYKVEAVGLSLENLRKAHE